jgi:autotransporter-associated beta strand protein
MKAKKTNHLAFLTLCFAPALAGLTANTANAQTRTWDGGAANPALLNAAANWSGDTLPNNNGDIAEWNGTVTGNLTLTADGAWTPTGGSSGGTSISVTPSQTGSLVIGGNQNIGLGNLDIQEGAGAVTINPTALMVMRGTGNATITNDSANPLTFGSSIGNWNNGGGTSRDVTFTGEGDTRIDGNFVLGGAGNFNALRKDGGGTLTFNGAQNGQLTQGNALGSISILDGTLKFGAAARIAFNNNLGTSPVGITIGQGSTFEWASSASQILTGVINGSGEFLQTAGNLTLTGTNGFFGTMTITGGTLNVSGAGILEPSLITIDGPTARYLHTSTVDSILNIPLTQGTVGGNGKINSVTVADNANATIANGNGNGGSGALTLGTLTFNGDGAINITEDGNTGSSGLVVTGSLTTTPANGTITVNASNSFWNSGVTYNLVSAGTFNAALSHFTLGTIQGITGRQAPSLVATSSGIGLQISGDNPKWSGLDNTNWVVGTTGPNGNWRLVSLNTKTDYIQGDVVLFDDSATGTTVSVNISAADVSPAVINFNNTKSYQINGPFGIAAGTLNKNGSGNVTIASPNTYSGGTTINAGTITLSGAGTLGSSSSSLTATGGSVNLGGTSQTVSSLSITGEVNISNGTLNAPGLNAAIPAGSAAISASLDLAAGNLTKSGAGDLTLSGTTAYSGTTTISGGSLTLAGTGSLGTSSSITLSGGSLNLGGKSINAGAISLNVGATAADTISNGTISPTSFTFNSIDGVSTVSANIAGDIGITAARLPGAGNPPPTGTLSLSGQNTFTGPLNFTGPATVAINGGSNTGGGAITYNSFGSTFTVNDGSYLTSGITSSGYSEFRNLIFNGGVLESQGNIFSDSLAISLTFNGGTLKSGSASGITIYDANNQFTINGGGATFDTSTGNITVGLNTGGPAAISNPIPRLSGTAGGEIAIVGGKTLASGISNNGVLDIQGNSAWNLNGVSSSVAGLSGNGSVTNSVGTAVLTINSSSFETYSGNITGGNNLSLVKQGGGKQELTGNNTYQGTTTVLNGILGVTGNSLPNSGTLIINGGAVEIEGTEVVASLFFGEDQQAIGTWGASGSGATNIDDTRFIGSGILNVVPPAPAGYSAWASANGLTEGVNDGPNQDPDFDGIPNLLEYVLGGLPIGAGSANTSILPVQTLDGNNITLTFRRSDLSEVDTTQVVQISTNLATWTNFATVGATSAGPVTVIEDSPTSDLDSVSVVIPRVGNAADGKLFVRLQAVKQP